MPATGSFSISKPRRRWPVVSDEAISWSLLTAEIARDFLGQRVVAIRGDDKTYAGRVISIDPGYIELASGNQRQILQHGNYRYMIAKFEGPPPWTPRMAAPKLPL